MDSILDITNILSTDFMDTTWIVGPCYGVLAKNIYRTRAIITRGLYTFYPLFEVQKRFFKGLFA